MCFEREGTDWTSFFVRFFYLFIKGSGWVQVKAFGEVLLEELIVECKRGTQKKVQPVPFKGTGWGGGGGGVGDGRTPNKS